MWAGMANDKQFVTDGLFKMTTTVGSDEHMLDRRQKKASLQPKG